MATLSMRCLRLGLAGWLLCVTPAVAQDPFVATLPIEEMREKQLVFETTEGTVVIDLLADAAPNHVGLIMQQVTEGVFDGTSFHRMVLRGIVQGGDPLTKDPAAADRYGQGGLRLVAAERSDETHTAGTVSAVTAAGDPDSGGTQFLICVVDQAGLDGQYTIWGRVAEGLGVVARISETPVDAEGNAAERVDIVSASIRDWAPPPPPAFTTESVEELAAYQAVLETDAGSITVELFPDRAPEHVRNFLRLADAGVYDGMAFHRVVSGFVIQTGSPATRETPLSEAQRGLITNLPLELSDTPHVPGIVSMARGDAEDSAQTSFFIVTGTSPELDGVYSVFARVVDGMAAVERIEATPTNGEEPVERVGLTRVRLMRR